MTFNQYYYKVYLPLHQNKWTKRFHFVGVLTTFLVLFYSLLSGHLLLLLTLPFIPYVFAWPSHYFFEKNKPAAFKNPWMAKLSDIRMFFDILRGKIKI